MDQFNESQQKAIRKAAESRLALLWGPPGTGKSKTAIALLTGLVASRKAKPIRIAVTGPNWTAIDNVAAKLPGAFHKVEARGFEGRKAAVARMSSESSLDSIPELLRDHGLNSDDREDVGAMVARLEGAEETIVVAGTADQLWKLAKSARPLFDVLLIDEASQMDVAHALLAFTCLADNAQVVVVGDDLQMPPIHPVDPPEGCGHLVGSIYDFFRHYRKGQDERPGVKPTMLSVNYRSNGPIVEFVREAGYGNKLESSNPDARLLLGSPVPTKRPVDWPTDSGQDRAPDWNPAFARLLDPGISLCALVHPDIYSSQQNEAEADVVLGLMLSLRGRLLSPDGKLMEDRRFFEEGLGVVTPHRAQQASIIRKFSTHVSANMDREAMYRSVDTVERFQGQEKSVIIASFGLGDADQIASEEEFLFNLNRFNVIASRAKSKLIVIVSRRLVDHLPRERDTLRQSRLLKHFVDGFLQKSEAVTFSGFNAPCELRYRDDDAR